MIRFALFGAGTIGTVHARNIVSHPRAKLSYVFDANSVAAESAASITGASVAENPQQIWSADDVDAVLIASSTNTHADLLSTALETKKAVFCEKPIDLDINRVKSVVALADEAKVPVAIGFSRRFDANHLALRESVVGGEIGRVEMIHLTGRDPNPPPISYIKVSGGQFRDQTIHFLDLARWLAGEDPATVYATGSCLIDPAIGEAGDTDTSMLILKMPSGTLCHINNSRRAAYGYDERIEVFGSEGMVESRRVRARDVSVYTGEKIIDVGLHPGWYERLKESFAAELDAFITSIEKSEPYSPSLIDGLKAQLIAEAAVKSLKTNGPVEVEY